MPVYLEALATEFYRGIGPERQYICPMKEMNFFVGANNSGKSIILDLLHTRLPFTGTQRKAIDLNSAENYRGAVTGQLSVQVGINPTNTLQMLLAMFTREQVSLAMRQGADLTLLLEKIVLTIIEQGHVWFGEDKAKFGRIYTDKDIREIGECIEQKHWGILWSLLKNMNGGGYSSHWLPQTLDVIGSATPQLQSALLIPAKRELGPKGESFDDLTGKGLINHLAEIQNPDFHEQDKKGQFESINAFLREVTGKADAKLEVPSNREHLLVHMDNKVLPLSSLGTGIHEVVLIATFCTIHQEKLMCIEEPEIHLHPILQRKLVRYLQSNTNNQYFIATHSAAFIDTPGAAVFRVHNDGVQTFVTPATIKEEHRCICADLGYRASDIVQANAVIWVEGPSDRIYIKHWLNEVAPELIETIHYSIMFYGGGLISHLSADDDAACEFIKLRDLNGYSAIVIDSDKSHSRDTLKLAAKRIRDELAGTNGFAWITGGREIENYVNPDILHDALKQRHSKIYIKPHSTGQYDHAFYFVRKANKSTPEGIYKDADKVRVAEIVCSQPADLSRFNLKKSVKDLVRMIQQANGIIDNAD